MIVNSILSLYRIADQSSINELGERIKKNRITHNQSYEFSEGNSVNSRLIRDDLSLLRYRRCLAQITHYTYALYFSNPIKRIVASKIDLKSAYQRAYINGLLAAMLLTMVGLYTLILLRLPFGGAYCPYMQCIISKLTCNLANTLLKCDFSDLENMNFSNKSFILKLNVSKVPKYLAQALPANVLVDPDLRGKIFYYINDLITIDLLSDLQYHLAYAVVVIIDVFTHPACKEELIMHTYLMSMKKLYAEGSLEEKKTILGWDLNFDDLTAALTKEKFDEQSVDIQKILEDGKTTIKKLDTVVGRNCHNY